MYVELRVMLKKKLLNHVVYLVGIYFVSIDAGAQVAIIVLAYGPCVVIVNLLGQFVPWVELSVQRRLCLIFESGVRLPDIQEYSAG